MNCQVSEWEYHALLRLKTTVMAVLHVYRKQKEFIGTRGADSLMAALEKDSQFKTQWEEMRDDQNRI
jgi:hypothetical protein